MHHDSPAQPGQARMGEVGPEPSVDPKMAQIRQLQAAQNYHGVDPMDTGENAKNTRETHGYVWKWGIPPIIAIKSRDNDH